MIRVCSWVFFLLQSSEMIHFLSYFILPLAGSLKALNCLIFVSVSVQIIPISQLWSVTLWGERFIKLSPKFKVATFGRWVTSVDEAGWRIKRCHWSWPRTCWHQGVLGEVGVVVEPSSFWSCVFGRITRLNISISWWEKTNKTNTFNAFINFVDWASATLKLERVDIHSLKMKKKPQNNKLIL